MLTSDSGPGFETDFAAMMIWCLEPTRMSSSMMMTDITDSNPKDILTFCFVTFLRLPLCLCLLNVCLFFLLSVANSRFVHHVVSFSLSLHLLVYRYTRFTFFTSNTLVCQQICFSLSRFRSRFVVDDDLNQERRLLLLLSQVIF